MHNKLITILGPTTSGKSDLAIKLAKKFNGEILSADSRQIYKEMDIGTNKLNKKQMSGISHYLIDIVMPNQEFTLSQYKEKAVKIIKEIQKRGKTPFLVGGTGLYIQAVVDNLKIPKVKPDKKLRIKLEKLSNQELFNELKRIDPKSLGIIDFNNKRRLIRALEVCLKTKKPFSEQREKGEILFNILQIGIKINKETVKKRIIKRTNQMIKNRLVEEVEELIKKYPINLPAFSGIGYKEIIRHLNNDIPFSQVKELINLHTQQYVSRQITWFKRDKRINWIENQKQAEKLAKNFLLR